MAQTVCEYYWKVTSASARPYASMEACLAAETRDRACELEQAEACAAFARASAPGQGLADNADCRACLGSPAPTADGLAEQMAALESAALTVHRAAIGQREWPADLEPSRAESPLLVEVDVELSGYGYRIDPDDFVLLDLSGEGEPVAIAGYPVTERLTRTGNPVAWDDPTIVDEPDLRILALFAAPERARGRRLAVGYATKVSKPFTLK